MDALFDEIEMLRMQVSLLGFIRNISLRHAHQLFETELRCAAIEADTREEVVLEMEARMRKMEKMYNNRMMQEVTANALRTAWSS